jgi:hypothetical protein
MADVHSFQTSYHLYILGKEDDFLTEQSKIVWALSYLQGGTAHKWCKTAVLEMMTGTSLYVLDHWLQANRSLTNPVQDIYN